MQVSALMRHVEELMLSNRREHDGKQYTVPSPKSYPYQWLWDSCFHAIILSYFDVDSAKAELRSAVSKQFQNGMLPHMIYWEKKGDHLVRDWGRSDTSAITQPPVIGYAVWKVFETDNDKKFLEAIYPKLWHYTRYLLSDRDPRGNNLIGIINPDESGEDDSPRFDLPLGLDKSHTSEENFQARLDLIHKNKECDFDAPFCMKNSFWVKDVPFNSIMVNHLRYMAKMAAALSRPEDKDFFTEKAEAVAGAMREKMLSDGVMWSTYSEQYTKIPALTWAIFAPLVAGVYEKSEAENLLDEYFYNEKRFKTDYLLPTVAVSESSFDPEGFWRGPVWISVNWLVYRGFREYGFDDEVKLLRNETLKLIEKSGFREHFHPISGDGQGAHNFTWGGLVLDMVG